MNISHFRFILLNLKIFREIVTTLFVTVNFFPVGPNGVYIIRDNGLV